MASMGWIAAAWALAEFSYTDLAQLLRSYLYLRAA